MQVRKNSALGEREGKITKCRRNRVLQEVYDGLAFANLLFWLHILGRPYTLVVRGSIYFWSNLFINMILSAIFLGSFCWFFGILHIDFFDD